MIEEATEDSFPQHVLKAKRPVVVDFWAEWCGPCKTLGAVIEEIAKDFDGKVDVVKVNVDQASGLAEQYGIRGIPTLIFFKDG